MGVVYLDSLFLLNLGLDDLLLATAARLSGARQRRWRTLMAAALGALYAVILFCLPAKQTGHPLLRAGVAVGMVFLAVGRRQRPLRVLAFFFLLSCSLAGGVLLLEAAGVGRLSNREGVPATFSDGKLLLLCAAGEYLAVCVCAQLPVGRRGGAILPVLLRCEGRRAFLRVLVDSGSQLRDPLSGAPVLIAERRAVAPLFPGKCIPAPEELRHPADCFGRLSEAWEPSRLRLIPYQAIGTRRGLLLALRVDEMEVDGVRARSHFVAVTAEEFPDGYQGLIGLEEGGSI